MSEGRDDPPGPGGAMALRRMDLASGRTVEVEAGAGADLLRIRGKDGACVLVVELTDAGPVLRFEGAALELVAPRSLDVKCGALHIEATESAHIAARSVEIEAKAGGVAVRANDDVRLNGERVMLNSTGAPIPLTWEEYLARQRERGLLPEPPPDEGGGTPHRDS